MTKMIAIGNDVYPEKNVLGYFENIEGIEGEYILEKITDDENCQPAKCRLKLFRGQNIDDFQRNLKEVTFENVRDSAFGSPVAEKTA